MRRIHAVTVEEFYKEHHGTLKLRLIAGAEGLKRPLCELTVNRPGLALAGFTRYFAFRRVQALGNAEFHFLQSLEPPERKRRYTSLLSFKVPCIVFCRGLSPEKLFLRAAEESSVPVFKSPLVTMHFINQATLLLSNMLAPQAYEKGSMVDVLGIGVIIRGESGIGKSECVLGLIERGYSLVSDDMTLVKLNEGREIIGTSPEHTRNYMEVRGIGIVDVPATFGVRGIRTNKRVDLVVTLRKWKPGDEVERLGLEEEKVEILGIPIPHLMIPVAPGRDLARLVEVAALHTKLRLVGHNPAKELNARLLAHMTNSRDV
jgi:HPr kinase/phosphorylase